MAERDPDNIKLAVLEEKLVNMVEVISRLDATIEKLSDLSINVSKMLAVHEEKLEFARESAAETAREMDDLEDRLSTQIAESSARIRTIERRVWMGMGIALAIVALLQSPIVTPEFFEQDTSVIIERRETD